MDYILGIGLVASIPVVFTLVLLYARAVRDAASERLTAARAVASAAEVGGKLRASEEQRRRIALVMARYRRKIHGIKERTILVGDASDVVRQLDSLLAHTDGDEDDPDASANPVSDWATPSADGADQGETIDD